MERMPERAKEALSHWKLIKDPEAEVSGACLPGPQARHAAGGGCGFPGTRGQAQAAPRSLELSPELRLPRKTLGNSGPGPVADRPSSGCRGPMRPAYAGPRGAQDAPTARGRPGPVARIPGSPDLAPSPLQGTAGFRVPRHTGPEAEESPHSRLGHRDGSYSLRTRQADTAPLEW